MSAQREMKMDTPVLAPDEWWQTRARRSTWTASQAGKELGNATSNVVKLLSTVMDSYHVAEDLQGVDDSERPNFPAWPIVGKTQAVFVYAGKLSPRVIADDE